MKKLIILALLFCFAFPVIAQEEIVDEPLIEEIMVINEATVEPVLVSEPVEVAEVTAEDLGTTDPTLLPSNGFYFLKDWSRNARLFFAFNPVKKAELRQKYANQQLLELRELAKDEDAKTKIVEKAKEKYEAQQEKLGKLLEKIKENTSDKANSFKEKYFNQQVLHDDILAKLEGVVSEDVLEKITETRNTHIEKFGENMFRLEGSEKIPERIENALKRGAEKVKNSEVINQIKERVQNKEHIQTLQQTKERVMNRVRTEIKKIPEPVKEQLLDAMQETKKDLEKAADDIKGKITPIMNKSPNITPKPMGPQN